MELYQSGFESFVWLRYLCDILRLIDVCWDVESPNCPVQAFEAIGEALRTVTWFLSRVL